MKKLVQIVVVLLLMALAILFAVRQISGWNDGMNTARSEIHAAVLDNTIYIAGGIGLFHVLDSCEAYDIKARNWTNCAPLPRPLHHVAMAADDQQVYASGGYIALPFEQDQDATLFSYNPQADAWMEIAKLPHPIGQHAMVHNMGKLFLIGGQHGSKELDTIWSYDLNKKKWIELAPMPTPRHSHAIALDGDKLYVTGGRSAALGSEIKSVEAYNFAENSWKTLSAMPTGRAGHGAFVRDGKLHVFGGESLSSNKLLPGHDILDLQSGKWSKGKSLTFPRHGFAIGDDIAHDTVTIVGGGAHPGMQTIYSVTGTVQTLSD